MPLGIKAFINKYVFINKYIFICSKLVNLFTYSQFDFFALRLTLTYTDGEQTKMHGNLAGNRSQTHDALYSYIYIIKWDT